MRICIDSRNLIKLSKTGGTGEYVRNLLLNLSMIDRENRYILFLNYLRSRNVAFVKEYNKDNFHTKACRIPLQLTEYFFSRIHLPIELLVGKVDIFHGTDFDLPGQLRGKSVITVHDLMYLHYPEVLKKEWVEHYKRNLKWSLNRADMIISVSNFVKKDIIDNFNVSRDKVRVVHNGISEKFSLPKESNRDYIMKKYGIDHPYILFVGTLEPKKNLCRLVEAFGSFIKTTRKRFSLVLAGGEGYLNYKEKIENTVHRLSLDNEVIFTGYIKDEDLPGLYKCSELFVFPSIFEGFGIPPLEAMASGIPVVASNAASLPEVVGDAGILVDPLNTDALSDAISSALLDSDLRNGLIQKGLERAGLFSWASTARKTLDLYNELGTGNGTSNADN
jgi:glycosyltransferase involved in cell wall biosynthesis